MYMLTHSILRTPPHWLALHLDGGDQVDRGLPGRRIQQSQAAVTSQTSSFDMARPRFRANLCTRWPPAFLTLHTSH